MLFEIVVKKIIEEAVTVEADNVEDAKYKASCHASDSNTLEVLEVTEVNKIN